MAVIFYALIFNNFLSLIKVQYESDAGAQRIAKPSTV